MTTLFNPGQPIWSASAPGRMDVMGGIADYSGSLLLQMPVAEQTRVRIQLRRDGQFILHTQAGREPRLHYQIGVDRLRGLDERQAGERIREQPGGDWASYVIGCFVVLSLEGKLSLTGATVAIRSAVPWGKGVSSSAAVEVAVLAALNKGMGLQLGNTELPLLAQRVENRVVGAPCGLMDQLSSYLGQKGRLLPLVCQPHRVLEPVPLAARIGFCGIDSGVRHAVSGASYQQVRTAAFLAYGLIARAEGVSDGELRLASRTGDWTRLPYGGYLSNIPVSVFERKYSSLIPDSLTGRACRDQGLVCIDPVSRIEPDTNYRLLACSRHPVQENFRVQQFLQGLQQLRRKPDTAASLVLLGELMLQSHAGYSSVGLGNYYTDLLVDRVMSRGPAAGLFGARVSGGGSGGTVCILYQGRDGKATAREIHREFEIETGKKTCFFSGSSQGAYFLNA
ncbi:MAG TPA: hypothetical protein VG870_05465 [Chitinophagaceae bacterium]|nr:hypothetical protein [Chitinophagaceae bacterium]